MKNFAGAFADSAVLLPLVVALSLSTGMSGTLLLVSAGLAYICAGFIFRVPMSIQPLKSVAVTAIALGASRMEVQFAALALGIFFLAMASIPSAERWSNRVPRSIILSMQFALGILLILQGARILMPLGAGPSAAALAVVALALFLPYFTSAPILGLLAFGGVLYSTWSGGSGSASTTALPAELLRPEIILSLLLPQLALTFTNSVLGTRDAARTYFGDRASRVTVRRLMGSIGVGNIISSLVGGLPFCHGAGGLTAHVRGGARDWSMNVIAGLALLGLAAVTFFQGTVILPAFLVAVLLSITGAYHLGLARSMLSRPALRGELLVVLGVTLLFKNLLYTLAAAILFELSSGALMRLRLRKAAP